MKYIILSAIIASILPLSLDAAEDPLPSWNDVESKKSIVAFVTKVINKTSKDYVAPANRIATFDNDGTLWNEKPAYIHLFANLARFKELMEADPELAKKEPYKSVATKDTTYFKDLMEEGEIDTIVGDLFGVPFEGMTPAEFAKWNREFLAKWKHPRYKVGYQKLIYQPMLELIRYLRANDFDVHIFTADEAAFLQLVSEEIYGVPPENVHGSSVKLNYQAKAGQAERLARTAETGYFNNWDGKPRLIQQSFGKPAIFAAGNSNGDFHMLQWTGGQKSLPTMALMVHHTDGEREDSYDKHTDKIMPLAKKDGWTIVDMKADWNTVFPKE